MLLAKRAGAQGTDPWHTLHRETATKIKAKLVKAMRLETVTKVEVKKIRSVYKAKAKETAKASVAAWR